MSRLASVTQFNLLFRISLHILRQTGSTSSFCRNWNLCDFNKVKQELLCEQRKNQKLGSMGTYIIITWFYVSSILKNSPLLSKVILHCNLCCLKACTALTPLCPAVITDLSELTSMSIRFWMKFLYFCEVLVSLQLSIHLSFSFYDKSKCLSSLGLTRMLRSFYCCHGNWRQNHYSNACFFFSNQ